MTVVNDTRVKDSSDVFGLCYKYASNVGEINDDLRFPVLTTYFSADDVKLQQVNMFVQVEEDLICLALMGTSDFAIFGNLAQINFLVGYDLEARTLSFLPKDCTQQ